MKVSVAFLDIEFETTYVERGVAIVLGSISLQSLQLHAPLQSGGYSKPTDPPS